MRKTTLAMSALAAAAVAMIAGSGPAAAIDYPYCIQGGGWAYRATALTGRSPVRGLLVRLRKDLR
jgi:hypothetical protein